MCSIGLHTLDYTDSEDQFRRDLSARVEIADRRGSAYPELGHAFGIVKGMILYSMSVQARRRLSVIMGSFARRPHSTTCQLGLAI